VEEADSESAKSILHTSNNSKVRLTHKYAKNQNGEI